MSITLSRLLAPRCENCGQIEGPLQSCPCCGDDLLVCRSCYRSIVRNMQKQKQEPTTMSTHDYYDKDENLAVAGPAIAPRRRPKLSSHLPVRFSADVLASARRCAAADGMSISSWIRGLVEREVVRRGPTWTEARFSGKFTPNEALRAEQKPEQ